VWFRRHGGLAERKRVQSDSSRASFVRHSNLGLVLWQCDIIGARWFLAMEWEHRAGDDRWSGWLYLESGTKGYFDKVRRSGIIEKYCNRMTRN
jgi:hypothetical protein